MKKNNSQQKTVYNFVSLTRMKFKSPQKNGDSEIKNPSVISKLKSFSWIGGRKKQEQKISILSLESNSQSNSKHIINPGPLKFIKKLTNQHFLIGNQFQVDVIYLGNIVQDFIDTEHVWSLNFKVPISNIAVDTKKYFIAFLIGNQVHIYEYNLRKSKDLPVLLTKLKTSGQVKFIQFAKDSFLTLFYPDNMEIYVIDESTKLTKKKFQKSYNQPLNSIIFQVPQAFQGVINIFFEQIQENSQVFHLWNLQVKLQKQQVVMGSLLKVYDISTGLKPRIVLSNYSKQIFCMNLGHQILAVKKGYIIDTVNSNIESDVAILRYLGNDRLIHVTNQKIQLYKFSINTVLNPPRISLQSTDSIYSKMSDPDYCFLDILEMLTQNIVVFYQVCEEKNKSLSGQIKYAFTITRKVKFEQKIKQILPSAEDLQNFKCNKEKKISDQDYEIIQEKCDMAMKMGLTRKEIYLRLWNNSTKCDISDYQFLLDTMDYKTIRQQIQVKLKKKSMVLRQVIKIEQGCLGMLQRTIFSHQVSQQDLKNFLISHYFLRKLKLYQLFYLIDRADNKIRKSRIVSQQNLKQDSQTIMINIKDYISYSKCQLKSILLELIRDYCFNQKQNILKIRTLIKLFKFSFRPIYSSLLQDIIKEAGSKLLHLLQSIPQILPHQHTFEQQPTDPSFYEGVWGNILPQQWESNLYAGGISTIDNKGAVEQMVKSVWSKRFFLSLHDLLPYSKKQILQIHERNKTQQTFYNFIEKVFEHITDKTALEQLIKFIESNYPNLPQHLIGQIFLYRDLFLYLQNQKALKPQINGQFNKFLKLKDFQIFKLIFDLQKKKKNCILKDVKHDIFNSKKYPGGNDLFNLALLNFFSSILSEISDIKYLLNRLNNEKVQFHQQNQGMYEVIVKGMQAKLYLGSSHDIPIQEVYIYIKNIHLDQNSEIEKDLKYLSIVNRYANKFKQAKLNMSVFEIIREAQKVLTILINYEVKTRKITQKTQASEILKDVVTILQETEKIKKEIYFETYLNKELNLFILLTILLEEQSFILQVKQLLESQEIKSKYQVNQLLIENSVLYMYKQKFSQQKIYVKNQSYIKELLNILPQQNQLRKFISNQLQLGTTLSCDGNMLEYPLGGSNGILSTVELQSAINFLPGQAIKNIDFNRIFQISIKMQQISSDGDISSITLYQIYQIVILRLLQCKQIKDCIPMIRKIIQINPLNSYNFIYPVLLIKKFTSQLCDQNRAILLMILTYQFQYPNQLLDIVQKLLNSKFTSTQQKIVLKSQLKRIQPLRKVFDKNNQLFDPDYLEAITSEQEQKGFAKLLRKALVKIIQTTTQKDEFSRNPQYAIIYTILCNNPYAVVKYLYCSRYQSNFKGIRCFFSYLINEQIFNRATVLQLGKRIFKILHQGLSQTVYIQSIIQEYKHIALKVNMDLKKIKPDTNLSIVMSKSLQRFKNKIKEGPKKKKQIQQTSQQRKSRIKNKLNQQGSIIGETEEEYPFNDSDSELAGAQTKLKKIVTNESTRVQFDSIFQRQLMISRNNKAIGMYLSQQFGTKQKQMFYSKKMEQLQIRNSVLKLKNKKKQIDEGYSLMLSQKRQSVRQGQINSLNSPRVQVKSPFRQINSIQLTQSIQASDFPSHISQRKFIPPSWVKEQSIQQQIQQSRAEVDQQFIKISPTIQTPIGQTLQHEELTQLQAISNNDHIINRILAQSEGQNYNTSAVNETNFVQNQFKDFISKLYHSEKLNISQSLGIIKKINQNRQFCQINTDYLEIYLKMQHFQKKFNLEIDLKKMFPIQGIFLETKSLNDLFSFVKDKTIQLLTESNVYKITKVMSLVFKNNDIQQQLNISFLIKFLRQFEQGQISDEKQVLMQKQKIKALTEKISIYQLNTKDQQILNSITNSNLRTFVLQCIAQAMKKKKNQPMAETMLKKWKQ